MTFSVNMYVQIGKNRYGFLFTPNAQFWKFGLFSVGDNKMSKQSAWAALGPFYFTLEKDVKP
jgi:hypothetical protein